MSFLCIKYFHRLDACLWKKSMYSFFRQPETLAVIASPCLGKARNDEFPAREVPTPAREVLSGNLKIIFKN
ncbi:MAG: hypothetical protein IKH45_01920 [Neisseriaceae bacterium]|nr:hypothetical protein [Neisseriaceae bacterium]